MRQSLLLMVIMYAFFWSGWAFSLSGFGDPENGQRLYSQRCVMCHGMDGRGRRGMAPDFFKEWSRFSKSDDELANSIRDDYRSTNGNYGAGGCPQHMLSDGQMEDLLSYLRALTERKPTGSFGFDQRGGFGKHDDFVPPF
ncbi:hypothetical protein MNBD_GAMMA26-1780 [hydrothermal vent metagenome]|uniref:Cytochrome c domain-containing protein n=1 Tax=hydrothermal vent metagenome TaxID=652676 RepID=A0A3B1C208_9ZZZZ